MASTTHPVNGAFHETKGFSADENGVSPQTLDGNISKEAALERMRTSGAVSISAELFEKLYLTPQSKVSGDLRTTFGNPAPLAILGMVVSLTPFSCDIMGWRGAGGTGSASIGSYYFMGGLLMILGGLGEWVLGNTFPFLVFCGYGAFWLTFASTLTPAFAAYGHYSAEYNAANPSAGLDAPGFAASFAFFLLAMGLLSFLFAIGTLRINICLAIILWGLVAVFSLLAATFWQLAEGNAVVAGKCLVAAGGISFACAAVGWWILAAQIFASIDFPIQLPVGDLSHLIKGASERKQALEARGASAGGNPV